MSRVVHFEIPSDNPERAMEFFRTVFGWQFQQFGDQEYWMVVTGDDATPGINGGLMKKEHANQRVANAVDVPDIDAAVQAIERAGGRIVLPKQEVGEMGYVAYFLDLDGNMHSVWQNRAAEGQT